MHRPSKFPEVEEELEKWLEECTQKNLTISDNAIRAQAKEIAKALGILEEKFKASAGWVENFKTRHHIRGGVWQGREVEIHGSRLLMEGIGDPILSPLNPAFNSRAENCDLHISSPAHDDDMDSQRSMVQEERDRLRINEQHIPASPSINGQSSWVDHGNGIPPAPPLSHSSMSLHHQSDQPQSIPQSEPVTHIHSHPNTDHPVHHEQYAEQTVYYPGSTDPAPLPTLAEAETAINTVITYLDTARRDLLLPEERQTLATIRYALFQEVNQIPFDRSTQA